MTQNEPLRLPTGFAATPQDGALYITSGGAPRVYANGAWRDWVAGTATRLPSRTLSVSGHTTGSVATDFSSDVSIPTTVASSVTGAGLTYAHPNAPVPMAVMSTTDYANTVGQNGWSNLWYNQCSCNDNNMWDGGGTVNLNTSGFYLITANVRFEADTDAGRRLMEIRVNGGYRWARGFGATNSGQWGRSCSVITHSGGSVNVQVWVYIENTNKNMRVYRSMLGVWKMSKWNGDGDTP